MHWKRISISFQMQHLQREQIALFSVKTWFWMKVGVIDVKNQLERRFFIWKLVIVYNLHGCRGKNWLIEDCFLTNLSFSKQEKNAFCSSESAVWCVLVNLHAPIPMGVAFVRSTPQEQFQCYGPVMRPTQVIIVINLLEIM